MNRYTFTPLDYSSPLPKAERHYVLFDQPDKLRAGSTGTGIRHELLSAGLNPPNRSWDLLSVALAVVAADQTTTRADSPDGWTRMFSITVAVHEPDLWNQLRPNLQHILRFLTTDVWQLEFVPNLVERPRPKKEFLPEQDSVILLSGGLDSLVGAIDLVEAKMKPYAVSQIARGEQGAQSTIVNALGGLAHIQLNHNSRFGKAKENSSRSRSLLFLAYGTLIATALRQYREDRRVTLYVCENGFISLNPPLTPARLGSLSTRTTHPAFVEGYQSLLDKLHINVAVRNQYQLNTKGQMMKQCSNQTLLYQLAHKSISCGKYKRHNYTHCGRCLPCLIRRAAFKAWGKTDRTEYKFGNLALNDSDHANYDDVRAVAMAIAVSRMNGVSAFLDSHLLSKDESTIGSYLQIIDSGLRELNQFLVTFRKKW